MNALAPTLAVLLAAAPTPDRRPLTVDDLLALERVESPALSPDGRLAAFTVARAAPAGDRMLSSLWIVPAAGGAPRRLTFGEERVGSPVFSPDGRRLAFSSNRAGGSQAWLLDLDGGEAVKLTAYPEGATPARFTPDGKALIVLATVVPACGADGACNERAEAEAKGRPRIATRLLHRHWNAWTERHATHVVRVPLDGSPPVDLTPGERSVPPAHRGGPEDVTLSPDGRTLYAPVVTDALEAASTNADLFAFPADRAGPGVRLTTGPGFERTPVPSPDGKLLAFRSQARGGYEADRWRVMVAAADGSGARELAADADLSAEDLYWTEGGKALRFRALVRGRHLLFEADVATGKVTQLTKDQNLADLAPSRDGRVAAVLVDALDRPAELAVLSGAGAPPRVLTRFAAAVLDRVRLGAVRWLEASGKDGAPIFGWEVLPPDHRPGDRHPGVVLVHGGPQGAWNDTWFYRWNAQLWAAQGWTVVLPNPRGSTGFGTAYTDAVRANWGGTPFDDVMALTDAAIAAGELDGARTCAAGASYGGYMVHWINGQTDRFRCLVAHAGNFDLEFAYYDTEELWFPEWELGRPWEDRAQYDRWSPHLHVHRWQTPTLVTHGELDYRVTVNHAHAAFTALQRRGVPSKLLVFPDEGHHVLKPRNARAFHEVVFGWIREHLGGPPPAAPPAPTARAAP
jgi:dipeptidyl aminopeptidase/acylaminoacyl peptidase